MNGEYVTESNPIKCFIRNVYLWLIQLVPAWKRQLEQGARSHGLVQYTHTEGMPFLPHLRGGLLFPQVYCSSRDSGAAKLSDGDISFTDDQIFASKKLGLFQLVVLVKSTHELASLQEELRDLESGPEGWLEPLEATVIVQDSRAVLSDSNVRRFSFRVVRVATAAEFAASALCENRPAPKYYDECRISKELPGKRYVVVRPDRFVYAACVDKAELVDALSKLKPALQCGE